MATWPPSSPAAPHPQTSSHDEALVRDSADPPVKSWSLPSVGHSVWSQNRAEACFPSPSSLVGPLRRHPVFIVAPLHRQESNQRVALHSRPWPRPPSVPRPAFTTMFPRFHWHRSVCDTVHVSAFKWGNILQVNRQACFFQPHPSFICPIFTTCQINRPLFGSCLSYFSYFELKLLL